MKASNILSATALIAVTSVLATACSHEPTGGTADSGSDDSGPGWGSDTDSGPGPGTGTGPGTDPGGDTAGNGQGTIDAVFFAQTHVQRPDHDLMPGVDLLEFRLVGDRETLIKAHVVDPDDSPAPEVTATLSLGGETHEVVLEGPETLPGFVPSAPGEVKHSHEDSFTGVIPREWVKPGLSVTVDAGADSVTHDDLNIGAPTRVIMTMFDVHFFEYEDADYPEGWEQELEARWPVSELEVRRQRNIVFPEVVIPPREGAPAVLTSSAQDYEAQTGVVLNGGAAREVGKRWNKMLKKAAGRKGRVSLYYLSYYGFAGGGGVGGGFAGTGNGKSLGVLHHEIGHALSLPHWGDDAKYPYKGDMYGTPAPDSYMGVHVGPTWGFHLPTRSFIPCTVQPNAVGGTPGTYKRDPMQGGGDGDQEDIYLLRHFSDYSINKIRDFLQDHVVVWSSDLDSWVRWDPETNDYTSQVSNDGVSFPTEHDVEVVSVLVTVNPTTPVANYVYPPIGPYVSGLIDVFDPSSASDRARAEEVFCPDDGCDVSLRVVQGGVEKTIMLYASWDPLADPLDFWTQTPAAINLPHSDGQVTRVELLLTPDAEHEGLPENPTVLHAWN